MYGPCHQHLLPFIKQDHEVTEAIEAEVEEDTKQGSESLHSLLQREQSQGQRVVSLWNDVVAF